jgi:hypothetical protein
MLTALKGGVLDPTANKGNILYLKGLDVKLEKRYWGDDLEYMRNNDTIIGLEAVKYELDMARGKIATANKPIQLAKQLASNIEIEVKEFTPLELYCIALCMNNNFDKPNVKLSSHKNAQSTRTRQKREKT